MKKRSTLLIACFVFATTYSFAQSSPVIKEYIAKYKDIAIEEMIRTGVPASITLAQGIHETEAGRSKLVLKSNNHFGIKCKTEWKGESVSHDDDARGECFRKYPDPFDSYRDHSDFLKTRPHYALLFKLDPTDYEGWAYGLKKAGYATNPKYPQLLIKLIRDYNLQDFSLVALGKKLPDENAERLVTANIVTATETLDVQPSTIVQKQHNYPKGVFEINETDVVFIAKGTAYLVVAEEHKISLARLFDFNDLEEGEVAEKDHLVFLQRKRKGGANEQHIVTEGETFWDIAQEEGLRMESLLGYNFLKHNMLPQTGEVLYLRRQAPAMPKIRNLQEDRQAVQQPVQIESNEAPVYTLHTVEPKETLFAISKKYEVKVEELMQWNNLETTSLQQGQQLRINKK